LLRKLSNDACGKYEIEVTKMGQNYSFFLTVYKLVGYTNIAKPNR